MSLTRSVKWCLWLHKTNIQVTSQFTCVVACLVNSLCLRSATTLQDIGGNDIQKQEIKEAVELPLTHHELYRQIGIDPPRGVLLYGPPGTGKTMLAKAVAHHTTAAFIRVVGSEFVQKYLGEVSILAYTQECMWGHWACYYAQPSVLACVNSLVSTGKTLTASFDLMWHLCMRFALVYTRLAFHAQGPRMVRDVFRMAKENAPAIIFIDEVDAIATSRFDAQTGADRYITVLATRPPNDARWLSTCV